MTVAVGLGLMEYPFEDAAGYWRWIDMCEAGGVDSIWQTDRIVSAVPNLECMTALAAIAGRTRRLKFGMNVVSLALRDPILLAKQIATIDVLSGGRMLPAFGIGSPMAPEWAALGIDSKTRGSRTDEALEVIARLWKEEKVDYDGRHFKLKGVSIAPRPVQSDIPMWIGGGSEAAIRRTAKYGTGWQGGPETPAEAAPIVTAIKQAAAEHGRKIDDDHFGAGVPFYFGQPGDAAVEKGLESYKKRTGRDGRGYFAVGGRDDIVQRIAEYVSAGVEKFILRPVGRNETEIIAQTERLLTDVLPEVSRRWPKPPKKRVAA